PKQGRSDAAMRLRARQLAEKPATQSAAPSASGSSIGIPTANLVNSGSMAQKKSRPSRNGRRTAGRSHTGNGRGNGGGRNGPGRRSGTAKSRTARRSILPFLVKWSVVALVWAAFFALCFTAWLAYDLPDVSKLNEINRRPSVTLL